MLRITLLLLHSNKLPNDHSRFTTRSSRIVIAISLAALSACNGGSGGAPVQIDRRPAAVDLSRSVEEASTLTIDLAAEPGVDFGDTPFAVAVTDEPQDGSAVVSGATLMYTPRADYFGSDALAYSITDNDGQTATGRVSIEITEAAIAPAATIHFPPALSLTDANVMTVTGAASDGGVISRVRINGVDASTDDGFAHWRAIIPLATGVNTLTVETTDASGNTDFDAARALTRVEPLLAKFAQIESLALDSGGNRIFGVNWDHDLPALIMMDDKTGDLTIVSDAMTGTGPMLTRGSGLALDTVNRRAFVSDGVAIISVDLVTGDRTIVSGPGTGPSFEAPFSYAVDLANNRLLVADTGSPFRLLAVDLTSGARTVLAQRSTGFFYRREIEFDSVNNRVFVNWPSASGPSFEAIDLATGAWTMVTGDMLGTGPPLHVPSDIALDAAGNRLFVTDFDSAGSSILTVDLATGDRAIIADTTDITEMLVLPQSIVWDSTDDRVIVSDQIITGVTAVDVSTGDVTIISHGTVGSGPPVLAAAVAVDNSADRALVASPQLQGLVAVDVSTGNRTIFSSQTHGIGVGPRLDDPLGLALDPARGQILVTDLRLRRVIAVDLSSGDRHKLSDSRDGLSPGLNRPRDIALDPNNDRAIVADSQNGGLIAVDLVTGTRSFISDGSPVTGPRLEFPTSVVVDPGRDLAYVVDTSRNAVLSADLQSGDHEIISATGTGPALVSPAYLALDPNNDQLLVSDNGLDAIVAIDLISGDRTIIADDVEGQGPAIANPGPLDFDASQDRAIIYQRRGLLGLEPGSGDRVIFSR